MRFCRHIPKNVRLTILFILSFSFPVMLSVHFLFLIMFDDNTVCLYIG